MPVVQRHLTAIAALGLLLVGVACGAADRADVALTGADGTSTDPSTTTTSPSVAVEAASTDATAEPTTVAIDERAAFAAGADQSPAAPSAADSSSTTAAGPDSRQLEAVDAAVERRDICAVYLGLSRFDLASNATDRLIEQLTRIRDVMRRSADFVAPAIEDDWQVVTDGTSDMLESLENDQSIEEASSSHYDDARYRSASQHVADWMADNCD